MSGRGDRDNLRGGAWLIADMSLNIWALSIVKWLGAGYPSTQIVCLRALVGLILIAPLIWRGRALFREIPDARLHLLRVGLSVVTLSASFFAIARVPLALFTAIGFTRPLVTMVLAALLLGETIGLRRWIAAGIALLGVVIAVNPGAVSWNWGLAALGIVVVSGSGAVVATRRLKEAPPIVLMAFYTAGLTLFSAPFALWGWVPIAPGHALPLLLVGCFAQAAQLCFLRAHYLGGAGFLSVLSYLSLVLSVCVGVMVFGEVPAPSFALGAALVVAAALWVTLRARTAPPPFKKD
ncbi:DMT family transporter [Ovoidimarina sediminis]|uniref:DMT family transporter n=1 Tax=Ovoidimarina sediminis TaxID=3079856 RepID=UPI00290FE27C|nr:DMT family transporter [Rhodophyticola sp. MJ-SS7]MDU8946215.1 DMT family transporter [Rhodophyticola sp. MJ-SS7]